MRVPLLFAAWLAAGAVVCQPSPTHAQTREPSSQADLDRLIARAEQAKDTNDEPEARQILRALNNAAPQPKVTCALGMIERRLGEFPEAAEHLTKCVADPPPQKGAAWVERMRDERAMARAEVGILTITAPPGSKVSINGEERGAAAGRELFLEPKKEHRVEVRWGSLVQQYTLNLGRGATRNLDVTFPSPPLGDWLVFGGVITSGALAVGGGVLYGTSVHLTSEAEHHRDLAKKNPQACFLVATSDACVAFTSNRSTAGTLRDTALGMWIAAGGVGLATTIYHFYMPAEGAPRVTIGLASVRLEGTW